MNRAEHLEWCKTRALEYAQAGDTTNALASLISDLGKHEETASSQATVSELGMMLAIGGHLSSPREMTDFINGVN